MSDRYASAPSAQDAADRMTKRVTNDVRGRVRRVVPSTELFSGSWYELSETYVSVATVAVMEERDVYHSPEAYVISTLLGTNFVPQGTTQLGKASSESTIWERDDVCVRLVVEEGKTNLIVRTMEDFYASTRCTPQSASLSIPSNVFEVASGALVRCTITALETLQTLDVRALISHCALALDTRIAGGQSTPISKEGALSLLTQEGGAVIAYLAHIVVNMEKLRNEDAIYEQLIELNIFQKVLQHGELNVPLLCSPKFRDIIHEIATGVDDPNGLPACYAYILERDFPANYAIFFTAFLASEHYRTNPVAVFPSKQEKQKFAAVMEPLTRVLMPGATVSSDLRKTTRPLTDAILRFK